MNNNNNILSIINNYTSLDKLKWSTYNGKFSSIYKIKNTKKSIHLDLYYKNFNLNNSKSSNMTLHLYLNNGKIFKFINTINDINLIKLYAIIKYKKLLNQDDFIKFIKDNIKKIHWESEHYEFIIYKYKNNYIYVKINKYNWLFIYIKGNNIPYYHINAIKINSYLYNFIKKYQN